MQVSVVVSQTFHHSVRRRTFFKRAVLFRSGGLLLDILQPNLDLGSDDRQRAVA